MDKKTSIDLINKLIEESEKKMILLDGGMGSELENLGAKIGGKKLWSYHSVLHEPHLITQVHLNYLNAGCRIIETASYQFSVQGLEQEGIIDIGEQVHASRKSELLAHQSKLTYESMNPGSNGQVLIALSIGPHGATQNDGSEYTGILSLNEDELHSFHVSRLRLLLGLTTNELTEHIDIVCFETIPSLTELKCILEAINIVFAEFNNRSSVRWLQCWISFACKNTSELNSGESFAHAIALCAQNKKFVIGVGVNCCKPEYVSDLIKIAKQTICDDNVKLIAYPNLGEEWDHVLGCWKTNSNTTNVYNSFIELACEWKDLGVTIIGGCCRVTPTLLSGLTV